MTGQPYRFTRQIPPVRGSKPYTCSCLEHYLAFLTKIQLCDILLRWKIEQSGCAAQDNSATETPQLLVTLL